MDPSQDPSQAKAKYREFQLQIIDAEIKSLEESIRALRHRRNELAPISSLPTEIIATIFNLLRGPIQTSPASIFRARPHHPPWFRVAHICRHWREIALNQPLFWSRVHFSSAGAAEMLTRARTAPLHLDARIPFGHWNKARFTAFRNELPAHISHTRHLRISAEQSQLRATLEGLISPAPTLEYLSLSLETYGNMTMSSPVSIPDNIFDGTAPRLSTLVLRNCDISWKSPLLRGLNILYINSPFETPDLSAWLDMLCEMAQLKELTLHRAAPSFPHDAPLPSNVERIVTLPSLVNFDISDYTKECGLTLAHLFLPALTQLCINAMSYDLDGSDVQEILPFVRRHFHGLQYTQPLQSMFVRNIQNGVDILVWSGTDIDETMLNSTAFPITPVPLHLSFFNEDWSPGLYTGVFDSVMASLPLDSLVTLVSDDYRNPLEKQEIWSHHAPRWPLLQRVHLLYTSAHGFTEMLLEDNGGYESPLLPSLTKLVLSNIDLSADFRLCDALMTRVEQGVPLETLYLRGCYVSDRKVKLLSEIVVNVVRI